MSEEKELLYRIDERLRHASEWQSSTAKQLRCIEKKINDQNVRVDRIEQREHSRARLVWIAITGVVAAVMGEIMLWLDQRSS